MVFEIGDTNLANYADKNTPWACWTGKALVNHLNGLNSPIWNQTFIEIQHW